MPLFVFISGYFSKNLEKRKNSAFTGLMIPFIVGQIVIGFVILITDKNLNLIRNPFYATYGTWYLIALFIWRTLMPDLVRIKKLSVLAVFLFFATPLFWGMDNTLGLPRTLGFFCYFLAGYYSTEKDICKVIRIPKVMCVGILLLEAIVLYICFDIIGISYNSVFMIFAHGLTISKELWKNPFIMTGYVTAFVIAIFNSVLFINLFFRDDKSKFMKRLAKIGEDTMPLYLTHLALIKIFAALMRIFPDIMYLILSIPVGVVFIFGLSADGYRRQFNTAMKKIESFIFIEEGKAKN